MSILYRYLYLEIIKNVSFSVFIIVIIYVAVDFFEKINHFIEKKVAIYKAFVFLAFKTPFIIAQVLPVCVILGLIITLGLMTRNNEMLALKTSGISNYQILKPIILIGAAFSLFLFCFAELIVPITVDKANQIWLKEVRKEPAFISKQKNIWLKDSQLISYVKYYNISEKAIFGVIVNYFDAKFRLIKRIDAKKAIFKDSNWVFYDCIEQVFNNNLDNVSNCKVLFYSEKIEDFKMTPQDLQKIVKKSEEMNFKELLEYVKKIESEGYDATNYRVDLYAKIANPITCIIVCLIGAGIAFKTNLKDSRSSKESMSLKIIYGISIIFLYWVLQSFCMSLGYGSMLNPVISAFAASFIFLCISFIMLIRS